VSGEPAVLRRRIQTSEFLIYPARCFHTSTAPQTRAARRRRHSPGFQSMADSKRVAFHSVNLLKPGWSSVWVRFNASFPPYGTANPSRMVEKDHTNEYDQGCESESR